MTTRLDRYVIRRFLSSLFIVTTVLLIVFVVMNIVNELRFAGQGDYHFGSMLMFVCLTLPHEIERFFPLIFMMSGLLLFSRMIEHREFLAMMSFGVSMRRIVSCCLGLVLVLSLMVVACAEWWTPNMIRYGILNRQVLLNQGQAVSTPLGAWIHVDQAYIHIREILNREILKDVTVYQFDDEKHFLKYAEHAPFWKKRNGKWTILNPVRTVFSDDHISEERVPFYESTLNINAQLLDVGVVDAGDLSLSELHLFSAYLEKNHINAIDYHYTFWMKLFQPWLSVCLTLFSLFFVMRVEKRTRLGFRMTMGVVFGFMFFLVINFLGQVTVVYQLPPLFSASLIPILCGIISMKLFKTIR